MGEKQEMWLDGVDWIYLSQDRVHCTQYSAEPSSSVLAGEFFDLMRDGQVLKTNSGVLGLLSLL
jgi:hypothetical protein